MRETKQRLSQKFRCQHHKRRERKREGCQNSARNTFGAMGGAALITSSILVASRGGGGGGGGEKVLKRSF